MVECVGSHGLIETIYGVFGKKAKVTVPMSKAICDSSVEELDLSQRARNGLHRDGCFTIGQLVDLVNADGIRRIRNEIVTPILIPCQESGVGKAINSFHSGTAKEGIYANARHTGGNSDRFQFLGERKRTLVVLIDELAQELIEPDVVHLLAHDADLREIRRLRPRPPPPSRLCGRQVTRGRDTGEGKGFGLFRDERKKLKNTIDNLVRL